MIITQTDTIILKVSKDPTIPPLAIFMGSRLDGLNELEKFQKSSENCNIFMVNETFHGQTIEQEYATIENGYIYSVILLNSSDMIPQSNLINKIKHK